MPSTCSSVLASLPDCGAVEVKNIGKRDQKSGETAKDRQRVVNAEILIEWHPNYNHGACDDVTTECDERQC